MRMRGSDLFITATMEKSNGSMIGGITMQDQTIEIHSMDMTICDHSSQTNTIGAVVVRVAIIEECLMTTIDLITTMVDRRRITTIWIIGLQTTIDIHQ